MPGDGVLPARAPEPKTQYKLRLFVTGTTARSARAIENLRLICERNKDHQYQVEVIDVYQNPEATRELQIVATPTLVRILPEPIRRIIGDLSDAEKVLAGLEIAPRITGVDSGQS